MNKTQKLLLKQLKKDYTSGKSKIEAFLDYRESNGNYHRGSLVLAMRGDKSPQLRYFTLSLVFLVYFWLPFSVLLTVSFLNTGSYEVFTGVFWIAIGTYLLLKRHVFGYAIFAWFLLQDLLGAIPHLGSLNLFIFIWIAYFSSAIALLVYAKIKAYPYQNLFHMRKNEDGTFVFTAEPGYQPINKHGLDAPSSPQP